MTTALSAEIAFRTLEVTKDETIAASIDIVFETILEQMGPFSQTPDGSPLPMKLEPWPGGRWYPRSREQRRPSLGPRAVHPARTRCWRSMGRCSCRPRPFRMSSTGFLKKVELHVVRFSHRAIGQIPPECCDGVERKTRLVEHAGAEFAQPLRAEIPK